MIKKDEFNDLKITNQDGDERFNEDVFRVPENEDLGKEIADEANEEFKVEEYEEHKFEENNGKNLENNQDLDQSSNADMSSTTSSTAGASSSAAASSAAASSAGAIVSSVASVAVAATLVVGVVALPIIPSFDVSLAKATNNSLSFVLSTNLEETEHIMTYLEGPDYNQEQPYRDYLLFEGLMPESKYNLSIFVDEEEKFSASYFTNNVEDMHNIFIEVYDQNETGFSFAYFAEGRDQQYADAFYNIKVIDRKGDLVFADDTSLPHNEYRVDKNVDATIFIYVSGVVEAAQEVIKFIPAGEVDYNNVEWFWAEDGESCYAEAIPSDKGAQPFSTNCDIETIERVEPTCEEDGFVVKKASFTDPNGQIHANEKEFILPATDHDYGVPEYEWNEDYTACVAIAVCRNNPEHKLVEQAQISYQILEQPSCDSTGLGLYTATFENEIFSSQEKEITIPKLDHVYGEVEYTWSEDYSSCTATRTCSLCEEEDSETVQTSINVISEPTCSEKGLVVYTANFTNAAFESQSMEIETDTIPHTFAEPVYAWNEDHSECTASRECVECEFVESEEGAVSVDVLEEATCEEDGHIKYTATFTNPVFEEQIVEEYPSAHGHVYGEPEYEWGDEYLTCTATRVCIYNENHVESETVETYIESETESDCMTAGHITYAALFDNDAFESQSIQIDKPLGEHEYGEVEYTWSEDYHKCTAKHTCIVCNHEESDTVDASYMEIIAPTCEQYGTAMSNALFNNPAFEEQQIEFNVDPLGHNYGDPEYTWSEDHSECTARVVCGNNSSHVISENVLSTYTVIEEPTEETAGSAKYIAEFDNDLFETQVYEITLDPIVNSIQIDNFDGFESDNYSISNIDVSVSNTSLTMAMRGTHYNEYGLEINSTNSNESAFIATITPTSAPIKAIAVYTGIASASSPIGVEFSNTNSLGEGIFNCAYKELARGGFAYWYTESDDINYFAITSGFGSSILIDKIVIYYKDPILDIDETNGTATFGLYPSEIVTDDDTISILNSLYDESIDPTTGCYCYNGELYCKNETAEPSSFDFNNGISISDQVIYWFAYKPVTWKIIDSGPGTYTLLSQNIIDGTVFFADGSSDYTYEGVTVYPNNYRLSFARDYLTQRLYEVLFAYCNQSYIIPTEIDPAEGNFSYALKQVDEYSTVIEDEMIYLPSYYDLYGRYSSINGSSARMSGTTDFAIMKGVNATSMTIPGVGKAMVGDYFTSSTGTDAHYNVSYINYNGYTYNAKAYEGIYGLKPIIRIHV